VSLRPEKIALVAPGAKAPGKGAGLAEGRINWVHYQGAVVKLGVDTPVGALTATVPPLAGPFRIGDEVRLTFPIAAMHAMEGER
jgi:hypothetical protein